MGRAPGSKNKTISELEAELQKKKTEIAAKKAAEKLKQEQLKRKKEEEIRRKKMGK